MLEKRVEHLYYSLSICHVQNTALSTVHLLKFLIFATYLLGGDYHPHFVDEAERPTQTCPWST